MKVPSLTLTIILFLAVSLPKPLGAQSGHDLLQRALVMERAEGSLDGAVILYSRILEEHGNDRALCVQALLQMAGFYDRLGRPEAAEAYQRIVEEYPDQAEAARQAGTRLEALFGSSSPKRQLSTDPDPTYTLLVEDFTRSAQGRNDYDWLGAFVMRSDRASTFPIRLPVSQGS